MTKKTIAATVAGLVLALGVAGQASARETILAPSKYHEITKPDRDFLRLVNGWANRLAGKIDSFNSAKRGDARIDRLRVVSSTGSSAASAVRFALKYGARPSYRPPVTPCVRRVGAQFAHEAALADDLYLAAFKSRAAYDRAGDRYDRQFDRTVRVAKACQKATR